MDLSILNKIDFNEYYEYYNHKTSIQFLQKYNNDKLYQNLIKSNDFNLQYKIAMCYYVNNIGCDRAFELFEISAKLHYLKSIYMLALCYLYGKGVDENTIKGISYMKYAAELNFIQAYIFIGLCCMHGVFTKKNQYDAIYWWKKAVNEGDLDALRLIEDNSLWIYSEPQICTEDFF